MIPIAEIYRDVWQGEGPYAGRRCTFMRTGQCNLHCEWCDTPYTWDKTRYNVDAECPDRSADEIIADIGVPELLIVTGGEPMMWLHNDTFRQVIESYAAARIPVHVETNGTIAPDDWYRFNIAHTIVSPKIAPQGDPRKRRLKDAPLAAWAGLAREGAASFKFVAIVARDVMSASTLCDGLDVPASARWIMPEGVDEQTVIARARVLAPVVAEFGMNLTLRQHVLMYGTERLR